MRTVYWDKPVDFDGRLIFGPMEAHKSMMGASWVTHRCSDPQNLEEVQGLRSRKPLLRKDLAPMSGW
jgi:hypothetical protein